MLMHAAGNIPVQLSDLVGLVRLELDGNCLSGEGGGHLVKVEVLASLRFPREAPVPSLIVVLRHPGRGNRAASV